MSDFCPRCEEQVRIDDPHAECKGEPWVNNVGVPGFDWDKLRVSGLSSEVDKLFAKVRAADSGGDQ